MKKLSLLLIAFAGVALTSCNAIAGAGKDIQKGGEAVTNAASRSSD